MTRFSLRSRTIRLAFEKPELRPVLLPLLKVAASIPGWEEVERGSYLDQIWDMYAKTYAKLGLSKGSKQEMVSDYNYWEIARGSSGEPVAFIVSKNTGLGTKLGLAGSDGSGEGKTALKQYLGTAFKLPGHYAEVSHAVEQVVMKHNPPVICASTVPQVIKKPVDPSNDGIHYTRNLSGVGQVEKVMVGNPRGIETTDPRNPVCPIEGEPVRFAEGEDPCDLDSHLACQIDL